MWVSLLPVSWEAITSGSSTSARITRTSSAFFVGEVKRHKRMPVRLPIIVFCFIRLLSRRDILKA